MRIDQQELLIQSIRAGTVYYKKLKIVPATIDQNLEACQVYSDTYDDCLKSEIMTEEKLEMWMIYNNLLPRDFVKQKTGLNKDIDQEKKNLYNNRSRSKEVGRIRFILDEARKALNKLHAPKLQHSQNTCEFIANLEKRMFLLRKTTYYNNKKYNGSKFSKIFEIWQDSLVNEKTIRLLARSEHWRTLWNIKKSHNIALFSKHSDNTEFTINQKNLITWSLIYDNVYESLESPDESVIRDDDMLDGWFLVQKEKQEKEQRNENINNKIKSGKISGSGHVFVMPDSEEELSDLMRSTSLAAPQHLLHNQHGVVKSHE